MNRGGRRLGRAGTRCAGGAGRLPSGLRSASPLLALPLLLVFGLGRRKRAESLLVVSTASIMAEPILPFLLGESRLFDAVEAGALNACPVRTIDVAAAGALDGVPYRFARLLARQWCERSGRVWAGLGGSGRVCACLGWSRTSSSRTLPHMTHMGGQGGSAALYRPADGVRLVKSCVGWKLFLGVRSKMPPWDPP